jgi:hypothetical protein
MLTAQLDRQEAKWVYLPMSRLRPISSIFGDEARLMRFALIASTTERRITRLVEVFLCLFDSMYHYEMGLFLS